GCREHHCRACGALHPTSELRAAIFSPSAFAAYSLIILFPPCCRIGDNEPLPAAYVQLSDGPKSRSSFSRVSRIDFQYFTNRSGRVVRKSWSTARRQKGLRPLSQACTSGGRLAEIDSSAIGFGTSVEFLRASGGASLISFRRASFHALMGSKSSIHNPTTANITVN